MLKVAEDWIDDTVLPGVVKKGDLIDDDMTAPVCETVLQPKQTAKRRKWVRKKNGLFGWVSIGSREKQSAAPNIYPGLMGENSKYNLD